MESNWCKKNCCATILSVNSSKSNIELPAIDFYGFVGVIVPGTILLVSVSLLFKNKELESLLAPENIGGLGIHLILAYIFGHLLQSIGNIIESVYWGLWQGMPTDWPVSKSRNRKFSQAIDVICKYTGHEAPSGSRKEQIRLWKFLVSQARIAIYAKGRAARLQVFVSTYGMFRGVLAAIAVVALIGWKSTEVQTIILYPVLITIAILAGHRMHRFGVHYAEELFANAAELIKEKDKNAT